jgi:hypothetical protein
MNEFKIKEIEARLQQMMMAKTEQTVAEKSPVKTLPNGVKVIRRRKGSPDKNIV